MLMNFKYVISFSDTSSTSSSELSFEDNTPIKQNNNNTTSSVFSKLAGTVRDTRSKVEQKKSELNASMQEKLPEWRSRGVMYGNRARETSMEWSRKGKEVVDKWKKDHYDKTNEAQVPGSPTSLTTGKVFGVDLKVAQVTSISEAAYIPVVIQRCIDYLDIHGIYEVGIYRIPGSTTAVNRLREQFESDGDVDFFKSLPEPHVVGTLLKMYLRELPEPLISLSIIQQYNDEINLFLKSQTDDENIENKSPSNVFESPTTPELPTITMDLLNTVKNITEQLPTVNQQVLAYLCKHLKHISSYSTENKMSTSNLAVIFIPTLGIGRLLFHCFIDHYNDVFKYNNKVIKMNINEESNPLAGPTTAMQNNKSHNRSASSPSNSTKPSPPPLPQKPKNFNIKKPPRRLNKSIDLGKETHTRIDHNKTPSDTDLFAMISPPPKPARSPISKLPSSITDNIKPSPPPPPPSLNSNKNHQKIIETKTRSRSISSPNSVLPSLTNQHHLSKFNSSPSKTLPSMSSSSTSSSVRSRSGSRVEALGRQFEQLIIKSSSPSKHNT
ncbi:unnamed protein product [Cunninghamella blakesleeana]